MMASSGDLLLQKDAIEVVQERLLPLAVLVTPNLKEAEVLSGMTINCMEDMKKAGQKMQQELGCANVLVKGGHLAHTATDLLCMADGTVLSFPEERIETKTAMAQAVRCLLLWLCAWAKGWKCSRLMKAPNNI